MPRIEQEYLIANVGLDPARINLIRHFYSQFDRLPAGANRRIANVEPLFFIGAVAGTEFLTYAATKLYLCFEYSFSNAVAQVALPAAYLYDENNVNNFHYVAHMPYYDTSVPAARYLIQCPIYYNVYFSRVALTGYTYMKFNGYRVTLD